MTARVNHVAIASDYYALNGRFYQSLFDMRTSSKPRPARSVVLGDGYVGLNCIPRRDGRYSGLDHFGIEVDDLADTLARIERFDRTLSAVKRRISHIALRTRHAERCAEFYTEVFGLKLLDRNDQNYHLSDGRVTLLVMPWKISDYYGQDPARTGLDHIGFTVESVGQVKRDLDFLTGENPHLRSRPLGYGPEGEARLKLLQTCPLGCFQLTDIEGVHIDVAE